MSAFTRQNWRLILGSVIATWLGVSLLLIGYMSLRGDIIWPQQLTSGPFQIRLYTLMIMLAGSAGALQAGRLARQIPEFKKIDVFDALMWAVLPGIVFARAYHVLTDWQIYQQHPELILEIWNGGLGIIGGIIGGLLGLWLWAHRARLDFLTSVSIAAVAMPLAQSIGRLGNFFNREIVGLPTDLPWGMYVNEAMRPLSAVYYHPLFLYESLSNLILWGVMLWTWRRKVMPRTIVATYFLGYAFIRFWLDTLRLDGRSGVGPLSYAQWLCAALWLAFLLWGMRRLYLIKTR